jgi:hypothetical protein
VVAVARIGDVAAGVTGSRRHHAAMPQKHPPASTAFSVVMLGFLRPARRRCARVAVPDVVRS